MNPSSEDQNLSDHDELCSFCADTAVAWLLPADFELGPDDPYPISCCDWCAAVLSDAMNRLPKNTDDWCFVDLAWLLRPFSDEESALWTVENLLGLNDAGGVV